MSPCHSSADHTLMPIGRQTAFTSNEFMILTTLSALHSHEGHIAGANLGVTGLGAQYEGGGDVNSQPAELTVRSLDTDLLPQGGQRLAQPAPERAA